VKALPAGMECDLEVTVTHWHCSAQNLDLRVHVIRDKFEDTVSSRRIRALPLAETQKFSFPTSATAWLV
jgi:hypothetical protein